MAGVRWTHEDERVNSRLAVFVLELNTRRGTGITRRPPRCALDFDRHVTLRSRTEPYTVQLVAFSGLERAASPSPIHSLRIHSLVTVAGTRALTSDDRRHDPLPHAGTQQAPPDLF